MTDPVTVEQCDRVEAARLFKQLGYGSSPHILNGDADGHFAVQAFARHRLAAQSMSNLQRLGQEFDTSPSREPGEDEVREAMERLAALPDDLAIQVRHHIREMYPVAVKAAPGTFLLSVGNCARNFAHAAVMPAIAALTLPEQPRPVDDVGREIEPRATIVDAVFADVRILLSGHLYIWQSVPETDEEEQVNLSVEGARALADAIYARLPAALGQKDRGGE